MIETTIKRKARMAVAKKRNFSILRLLRYISPPPPKTGEIPPPCDCNKTQTISKSDKTIWRILKIIRRLLYGFYDCFCKLYTIMVERE